MEIDVCPLSQNLILPAGKLKKKIQIYAMFFVLYFYVLWGIVSIFYGLQMKWSAVYLGAQYSRTTEKLTESNCAWKLDGYNSNWVTQCVVS